MARYVRTGTVLDRILENTLREVEQRKDEHPLAELREWAAAASPPRDLLSALHRVDCVALIAEVKRASPSRGDLVTTFDPVAMGRMYEHNGAAAISVLTDRVFFKGDLQYLAQVREAVHVPVLRKDFIIDPYQLYEARAAGADAVLLIVAGLADDELAALHALGKDLGMTVLVEVHDEAELGRALRVEPALLGVNNRDLRTFEVDRERAGRIATFVPEGILVVAESGMVSAEDVFHQGECGIDAVLVGEALVTASDVAAAVRAFSSQPRRPR